MDLPLAGFLPESIGPYIGLMIGGFIVGAIGHASRSRWLVLVGVIMILLATLLFPFALQVLEDEPPKPGPQVPIARTIPPAPLGEGLIRAPGGERMAVWADSTSST